jgi:hypothetical protein
VFDPRDELLVIGQIARSCDSCQIRSLPARVGSRYGISTERCAYVGSEFGI